YGDPEALAEEYKRIRGSQGSGPTRTRAMTRIVQKMIAVASRGTLQDLDSKLQSGDGGQRLAAYSYLVAKPDFKQLEALVDSVVHREDTPFGQYWGLQAIESVIGTGGAK